MALGAINAYIMSMYEAHEVVKAEEELSKLNIRLLTQIVCRKFLARSE